MTGTLHQLITLVTFGNDYLLNNTLPDNFYPSNKTFTFCNKVDFHLFRKISFSSKFSEIIIANDPEKWFEYLKENKCKFLRLYYEPSKNISSPGDHMLAGFVGGGGSWMIEAVIHDHSIFWVNRWEVTKKDDPKRNIWSVSYAGNAEEQITRNLQPGLEPSKVNLRNALSEIKEFSSAQELGNWVTIFDNAEKKLDNAIADNGEYYDDLIPADNYSLPAKQLLFSAASAWVFGGMGSWNDQGFSDNQSNELYDRLSATLYDSIIEAIISAVNSY